MDTKQIKNLDPSPWVPEKDTKRLRVMGKLLEELGELTAALSRCIIQGINEVEPVTKVPNRDWLHDEIADVYASLAILTEELELDIHYISNRTVRKSHYMHKWLEM